MNATERPQESRKVSWTAVVIVAAIVVFAGLCLLGVFLRAISFPPAETMHWVAYCGIGAVGLVVLVVILQGMHETRATRRFVAEALRDRPRLTDEEFGQRFYEPDLASLAARLRCLLAENLECDLGGMTPADDFEAWLSLFPGPDSAADSFFEQLATEFQLRRDCPWPERFGSFDALVKFVSENASASKT
jgi:hypothetical protein